jgi:hypothetical protein
MDFTQLRNASFIKANLTMASFNQSIASDCDFSNSKIKSALINGSNFHGSNFTEATLEYSKIDNCNLTNTTFNTTKVLKTVITNVIDLTGSAEKQGFSWKPERPNFYRKTLGEDKHRDILCPPEEQQDDAPEKNIKQQH